MVNTKEGREVPEILLFLLALVVRAGPTPPAPFAADEGGERAELEEGGRDLERERDAGEGKVYWKCVGDVLEVDTWNMLSVRYAVVRFSYAVSGSSYWC